MPANKIEQLCVSSFDSVPALAVVTDTQGRIVLFNKACEQMTGYDRTEVIGRGILGFLVPDAWIKTVLSRFADLDSPALKEPHQNPWKTKRGIERLIEWRCAPMQTNDGTRYVIGIGIPLHSQNTPLIESQVSKRN